jgi:hypothetical protein
MKLTKFDYALIFGPALMFAFGFILNAIVMSANGGQMPVLMPGGCPVDGMDEVFPIHVCMTATSHLKFLADWIVINHFGIASPGDFFLWGGESAFWPALFGFFMRLTKEKQ